MSETSEMPPQQEIKTENSVVGKVKGAINNALEHAKETNKEYWGIRKELQGRLAWNGGGVYRLYVENMDKITEAMWGRGDRNFGSTVMEIHDKVRTRLTGAMLAFGSAVADIMYNAETWPLRLFLPIPKDIVKRAAIGDVYTRMTARAALSGVAMTEMAAVRGVKAVGEAAVTAPEVVAVMAKRRVDRIIENIKKPKIQEVKPA